MENTDTLKTPHQLKGEALGISPLAIAECQRANVLPKAIKDFTEADEKFLRKLSKAISDPTLLRMQMVKLPKPKRNQLLQEAKDANLKLWELRALRKMQKAYKAGQQVDVLKVLLDMKRWFKIKDTEYYRQRLRQLRKLALTRAGREKDTNWD